MKQWYMVIDIAKCEDCNNCFLACKDEHVGNDWPGYAASQPRHGQRWVNIMRKERGQFSIIDVAYRPTPCMHCTEAPCVKAAKGSIAKRQDGIVLINPERSKGHKELVEACPYHVIWWNEEQQIPQKCTFCAHLLDLGWKQPRCVQACPTGALRVEYLDTVELGKLIAEEGLEVLRPELNTGPRVFYKNLYRFTQGFIAGSVATEHCGVVDCVEGAIVKLFGGTEQIAAVATDNFGDFKIDNLPENSGKYNLEISLNGYGTIRQDVNFTTSITLGTIMLPRLP